MMAFDVIQSILLPLSNEKDFIYHCAVRKSWHLLDRLKDASVVYLSIFSWKNSKHQEKLPIIVC